VTLHKFGICTAERNTTHFNLDAACGTNQIRLICTDLNSWDNDTNHAEFDPSGVVPRLGEVIGAG